jgi:hypothetical protein
VGKKELLVGIIIRSPASIFLFEPPRPSSVFSNAGTASARGEEEEASSLFPEISFEFHLTACSVLRAEKVPHYYNDAFQRSLAVLSAAGGGLIAGCVL